MEMEKSRMEKTHEEVRNSQEEARTGMASECSDCQVKKGRGRHCGQGGLPHSPFFFLMFIDVKRSIKVCTRLLPVVIMQCGV